MTTNVFLRELDFGLMNEADGRRLEVVADGLPLSGGAQLAVDTTKVNALRIDGTARPRAGHTPGVALAARRRKEGWYPELVGPRARSRLVVFGVEVGGRWSGESQNFTANSPGHARERSSQSSAVEKNRLGAFDGIPWCLVWWHAQWLLHCGASSGSRCG